MKLTKFPVISPSGVEYRVDVNVDEMLASVGAFADIRIKVFVPRPKSRFFPWSCVWTYENIFRTAPDIVKIAQTAVLEYEKSRVNAYDVIETYEASKFNEWDGRIAE